MYRRAIWPVTILLLISACNRKAEGQTVALVNNEEITASELNAELKAANVPNDASAKDARAQILQSLIDRHLLTQEAKASNVDKSPDYLNEQRKLNDNLLMNMLISRQSKSLQVPTSSEIAAFESSHPNMFAKREKWTLQQLRYPTPKDGQVLAKIATTKTLDQLANIITASGVQFTRGTTQIDTAIVPSEIYAKVNELPAGEPFVIPGGGQSVASVVSARQSNVVADDQAQQGAVALMREEQIRKIVQNRLKTARSTAKIEYQPGFAPTKR